MSTINLLPSTPEQMDTFVYKATALVKNGFVRAEVFALQIRKIQDSFEQIQANIKENVISEVLKHGNVYSYNGETISYSSRKTMDYSNCGHDQLNSINAEIERLKSLKSIIEKELKYMRNPQTIVDKETGEVKEINPPVVTKEIEVLTFKLK
jgi:hypothetical protein